MLQGIRGGASLPHFSIKSEEKKYEWLNSETLNSVFGNNEELREMVIKIVGSGAACLCCCATALCSTVYNSPLLTGCICLFTGASGSSCANETRKAYDAYTAFSANKQGEYDDVLDPENLA